jgi:histidinol-phosphatase
VIDPVYNKSPLEWLAFLNKCADISGPIALSYFNRSTTAQQKSDKSIVTEGDLEIERQVRRFIEVETPKLSVIGEEFGEDNLDAPVKLIIDPIDATSNFARQIPIFATLLAIECQKTIIAAVVFNPATQEKWEAAVGHGAYLNQHQLNVSTITDIHNAQAFHGGLYGREARGDLNALLALLKPTHRQRGLGDFLMHMYVAQGVGEFAIDFGLKPWDLAPLGLIVKEAGGRVTSVDGSTFSHYEGSILTSNGYFHDQLVSLYGSV